MQGGVKMCDQYQTKETNKHGLRNLCWLITWKKDWREKERKLHQHKTVKKIWDGLVTFMPLNFNACKHEIYILRQQLENMYSKLLSFLPIAVHLVVQC